MLEEKLSWNQVQLILQGQFDWAREKHENDPIDAYWDGVYNALKAVIELIQKT